MKYWMFTVMYDWYPTLWPTMVKWGLAAQHYPPGWTNEPRNWNALRQLKQGDAVIAALKQHRFAGYGFLKSDFFRGGESLLIEGDGETYAFQERAEIDWTVVPQDVKKPYVDCGYLKAKGYDVDLRRGLCVKRIDEKTFTRVRGILDKAGARPFLQIRLPEEVPSGLAYSEGCVQRILINRYERDPRAREECIRHYGTTCFLCGFDFVTVYGNVMAGFTHVHHLKPLASVGADYEVDPIQDLRPVCPNCHAVLHRREPPYSLEEVRGFLQAHGGAPKQTLKLPGGAITVSRGITSLHAAPAA
jgi:hypothetical protein